MVDCIYVPLQMTFKQALFTGVFLSEWEKENIVPIYKKQQQSKYQ